MSYDLNFWSYKPGIKLDAQKVYEKLCDGEAVEGLNDLPISAILDKIATAFKNWKREDDYSWVTYDASSSFQVTQSQQFFRVDCGHMSNQDMDKFIEIALEFGCPLYDPQINERFETITTQPAFVQTSKTSSGLFGFLKRK